MNRLLLLIIIFFSLYIPVWAQQNTGEIRYSSAILNIESGNYKTAFNNFKEILSNNKLSYYHQEALYWLIKTGIVIRSYDEAANYADLFISRFKLSKYYEEIYYHRARLYIFQNQPEKSLESLEIFITQYPASNLVPSSYYWMGEAFIKLGRLNEAQNTFNALLKDFPANVKREAALFRLREIKLQIREKELIEMLKTSHENYLDVTAQVYLKGQENRQLIQSGKERDNEITNEQEFRNRLIESKLQIVELRKYYIDELLRLSNEY